MRDKRTRRGGIIRYVALAALALLVLACRQNSSAEKVSLRPLPPESSPALTRMVEAAREQPEHTTSYDQSYVQIDYPGGDVTLEKGACTDVVIRAFRRGGVDLQKEVHEDMTQNFAAYPTKWGLKKPDLNIDHRRVPNLQAYFERQGKAVPNTLRPEDYLPGDVVTWDLGNKTDHIGIVTNVWSEAAGNYLVVHNIGRGAKIENVLFAWPITGHYRYF